MLGGWVAHGLPGPCEAGEVRAGTAREGGQGQVEPHGWVHGESGLSILNPALPEVIDEQAVTA
jgi:hypothetical protein